MAWHLYSLFFFLFCAAAGNCKDMAAKDAALSLEQTPCSANVRGCRHET